MLNIKTFQIMFYALRFKHPKCLGITARIPLAQAVHESSDPKTHVPFTSNLALTAHNLFGMQYPSGRAAAGTTTAIGKTASGFANYRSVLDSIEDYFYFCENWNLTNDADLDEFVHHKYAEDPNYYVRISAQCTALQSQLISPSLFICGSIAAGTATAASIVALVKALR